MTFVVCKEQYNRSSGNFYLGEKYEIQTISKCDLSRLIFHHGGHVYVDLEDLEKHFCSIEEWREIQLDRLID